MASLTNTLNSFISKEFGLKKMKKEIWTSRYAGRGNVAYTTTKDVHHTDGDFYVEKYYQDIYIINIASFEARELCVEITDSIVNTFGARVIACTIEELERFARGGNPPDCLWLEVK